MSSFRERFHQSIVIKPFISYLSIDSFNLAVLWVARLINYECKIIIKSQSLTTEKRLLIGNAIA